VKFRKATAILQEITQQFNNGRYFYTKKRLGLFTVGLTQVAALSFFISDVNIRKFPNRCFYTLSSPRPNQELMGCQPAKPEFFGLSPCYTVYQTRSS